MHIYEDLTPALRSILLQWTRGYRCWTSFTVTLDKLDAIGSKWTDDFGTRLPAWKRQDRKAKRLANAVAIAAPAIGTPGVAEVILMATADAMTMPAASPWARERWKTSCVEFSEFVLVHEPRDRGDYAWTWRLQERTSGGVQKHFTSLVKSRRANEVRRHTDHAVRFYPMFGGVRRQMRRLLRSARKLWLAQNCGPWPGPDPENLPFFDRFRKLVYTTPFDDAPMDKGRQDAPAIAEKLTR
jgi:hypothetical protein